METRNVVIVMGRCGQSKRGFGMRFERREGNVWVATWAFPLRDDVAKREGYTKTEISGQFGFDQAFPGCPHCGSRSFFKCQCGRASCWSGEGRTVTCPWCGGSGEVGGAADQLSAGEDG
jgi:hypothetical protein